MRDWIDHALHSLVALGMLLSMRLLLFIILSFLALPAHAGGAIDGASLSLWWGAPFASILLSLALGPILFEKFWHAHYGKLILGLTLAFAIPAWQTFGFQTAYHQIMHHLLLEYVPFVILIGSLFVVTGGIRLKADWLGTPLSNLLVLSFGTLAASFIGTTGASMLLIRPLIRANAWREKKVHVKVFFIFLVANIGGSLTPLGDPPLFLGFLEGVPFFWPMKHMAIPLATIGSVALAISYFIDRHFYKKEKHASPFLNDGRSHNKLSFEGRRNFFFLACILGAVLLSGFWKSGTSLVIAGTPLKLENLARDVLLLVITLFSLALTHPLVRKENHFSWDPLIEIVKIFFGIFITVIPVIAILSAGEQGSLSAFVSLASHNGLPHNPSYFWLTGLFSSFLDNAPTYFVFFHMAGGDVPTLTTTLSQTLLAISMGSVFMGAMTYIGNAPNFMVKSIAEQHGVKMPSFFGYMAWSFAILLPLFILVTCLFFCG